MHRVMELNPYKYTALCDLDDLIQCANIGLVNAMRKYDVKHKSSANFNTFAHWEIRKELQDYMRKYG